MIRKPAAFNPKHFENKMSNEGNVVAARCLFYETKTNNLKELLKNRYEWMTDYIREYDEGIEVGSGTGLSKEFIKNKKYKITDFANHSWLDYKNIDALKTNFDNEKFDFVISSNMIHHVPYPMIFLKEMSRILKKDGFLIIQEINSSFFMRLLLKVMKHEGYSYESNVFKKDEVCTDADDLWSANCAIPNLLFDNTEEFEEKVPDFKIVKYSFDEFFCFINSGGVIAKIFYIPLPKFLIFVLQKIDKVLASFFPSVFALQRQIVLRKK